MRINKAYFDDPIIAAYIHISRRTAFDEEINNILTALKEAKATSVWTFIPRSENEKLEFFMNRAYNMGLKVVPVLQPEVSIEEHPEVRIICADGSTSDDPRYFNIGCFNHPLLLEKAKELIKNFLEKFKDHPALYKIGGLPLLSFVHEAYYRTDIPEFGGGPLKPCCYCEHCVEDFRKTMKAKYKTIINFNLKHGTSFRNWDSLEPPKEPSNPSLWKEWFDYHAEIIPKFLAEMISYAKSISPINSTHELNDFYPCSYQTVYSGNDIYRMARVIDVGHEDMYPLEFDHRYVIYVYEYIKDLVRAAMGFDRLYTANGQSFNSWLGYKVPVAGMFEQIYSCLAHGSLGIVWWVDWRNLKLWAQTKQANEEFSSLVSALKGFELSKAEVALIYPWTTMELKTDDEFSSDNLLFYMALVRSGIPVDIISEQQIVDGVFEKRGYKVLCAIGCPVLPPETVEKIKGFVEKGGTLIQDYEGQSIGNFVSVYPELVADPFAKHTVYTIKTRLSSINRLNGKIIPVGNMCEKLSSHVESKVIARFENGEPAVIVVNNGKGMIVKSASMLGWDYSNYPGHYDFALMFPSKIRRDETVRELVFEILKKAKVKPPVVSSNPDVEVAVWKGKESDIVLAINHLNQPAESKITLSLKDKGNNAYSVQEYFSKKSIKPMQGKQNLSFEVKLTNFQGKAYLIKKQ